jgi:hypothetical protein
VKSDRRPAIGPVMLPIFVAMVINIDEQPATCVYLRSRVETEEVALIPAPKMPRKFCDRQLACARYHRST